MYSLESTKIAITGLGLFGLALAVDFGKHDDIAAVDISAASIDELRTGHEHTLKVNAAEQAATSRAAFERDLAEIATCNITMAGRSHRRLSLSQDYMQ
jgi:UDP-N-acetyl-D-galactosamine dehydrogenase